VGNTHRLLVERAVGVRYDPARLRALVHRTLADDPLIRRVVVEVTQGGEWVEQALAPLPNGIRLEATRPTDSKLARITSLFDLYQRGKVVHARKLSALEQQQLAFPGTTDDIVDAVETACRTLLARHGVAMR
jgi:phage terminase large subunit-like protein